MAKVEDVPLQIVIDPNFSAAEHDAIVYAVSQWNAYGKEIRGDNYFAVIVGDIPEQFRRVDPRNCGEHFGYERKFYILKETSASHWKDIGFDDTIPGATLRCIGGETVSQQIIFLRTDLVDNSQVSSVAIHELGHSLGLDHSCSADASRSDFIACTKLAQGHPYRSAVMFPSIRTVRRTLGDASSRETPEIKNRLAPNDKLRASCLYPAP